MFTVQYLVLKSFPDSALSTVMFRHSSKFPSHAVLPSKIPASGLAHESNTEIQTELADETVESSILRTTLTFTHALLPR